SSCIRSFYLKIHSYVAFFLQGILEPKLQAHLGSFGAVGNLALQPMCTLSGGQKSRVAFAKITTVTITFKKPHIVLLDKPSNHLDLDAVEMLIQGLVLFLGWIISQLIALF
ncbi:ABC transporter F family member 3-like, partial [Syzygium oleosum]|uniref:ABC transporter F family member 3-like n=1 Tax=Syzygium oleosum TaxID=219896 RepID=UPI0024BB04D5